MSATAKKKRKPRKPRWTYLIPITYFMATCEEVYGNKSVRIAGYPIKPAKVKQLAKWFVDAERWLEEREGEK